MSGVKIARLCLALSAIVFGGMHPARGIAEEETESLTAPRSLQLDDRLWDDEVVYVLIVQKFFNGDPSNDIMANKYAADRERYEGGLWGGDLAGVLQKLDDLADLGVTTLMFYPVIKNDESRIDRYLPTGYRPKDYYQVDENFGGLDLLRRVVAGAHARGMRVILDLPLAMPGFEHPFVTDPAKKEWFGAPTMYGTRAWNVDRKEVADYLIDVAKYWRKESGCDGFRMDSAHLLSLPFWERFNKEVKAAGEGPFVIFAENVKHPRDIGLDQARVGFDSSYDFSAGELREVLGGNKPWGRFSFVLKEGQKYYPRPRSLSVQINNYEDPEFLAAAHEPKQARFLAAMVCLLTLDRVPLLFTGDELGINYREVGAAFPEDRKASSVYQRIRNLIALRQAEPALRRGDWTEVFSGEQAYAFLRTLGDRRILAVANRSAEPARVQFAVSGTPWGAIRLTDLESGQEVKAFGGEAPFELAPFEARVLCVELKP